METLKVTRTYSTGGLFVQTWAAGRVGHGTAIHVCIVGANAICGTGNNGRGTRGRRQPHLTKTPISSVTCEKCLTKLKEAQADTARNTFEIVNA